MGRASSVLFTLSAELCTGQDQRANQEQMDESTKGPGQEVPTHTLNPKGGTQRLETGWPWDPLSDRNPWPLLIAPRWGWGCLAL